MPRRTGNTFGTPLTLWRDTLKSLPSTACPKLARVSEKIFRTCSSELLLSQMKVTLQSKSSLPPKPTIVAASQKCKVTMSSSHQPVSSLPTCECYIDIFFMVWGLWMYLQIFRECLTRVDACTALAVQRIFWKWKVNDLQKCHSVISCSWASEKKCLELLVSNWKGGSEVKQCF